LGVGEQIILIDGVVHWKLRDFGLNLLIFTQMSMKSFTIFWNY